MNIRPMIPADHEKVTHLLQELWGHNPLMLAQYRSHRGDWPTTPSPMRKSVVVEIQGEVIAAGTLFESTLHPQRYVVFINVARAWQGQGIGTQIYNGFLAEAGDRPWMVKVSRGDPTGKRFLENRGYREAANSLIGVLDPTRQEVKAWLDTLPARIDGYQIVRLKDNLQGGSRLALARLLAQVYAQYHAWNPPGQWSDEKTIEIFVGPSTIPGSALLLMEGSEPIGAAVLFHEASISRPNEGYLVHVGVLGLGHPKAAALTQLLIRHALEIAAGNALQVRFEADNEYVPHRELYESAPAVELNRDLYVMTGHPEPRVAG